MKDTDDISLYQTTPVDIADSKLGDEYKSTPLPFIPATGTKNLNVDDLERLNTEHGGKRHIDSLSGEQKDQVEHYLRSKGIEPPRRRKYF